MKSVAYAVVRDDPPSVYVADSIDVLQRLLALEVVARTPPSGIDTGARDKMRADLLDERWADAVVEWMSATGVAIDVYTHLQVYGEAELPPELIGAQLQFSPLFLG